MAKAKERAAGDDDVLRKQSSAKEAENWLISSVLSPGLILGLGFRV